MLEKGKVARSGVVDRNTDDQIKQVAKFQSVVYCINNCWRQNENK
jgi:hypothetical protein